MVKAVNDQNLQAWAPADDGSTGAGAHRSNGNGFGTPGAGSVPGQRGAGRINGFPLADRDDDITAAERTHVLRPVQPRAVRPADAPPPRRADNSGRPGRHRTPEPGSATRRGRHERVGSPEPRGPIVDVGGPTATHQRPAAPGSAGSRHRARDEPPTSPVPPVSGVGGRHRAAELVSPGRHRRLDPDDVPTAAITLPATAASDVPPATPLPWWAVESSTGADLRIPRQRGSS